MTLQSTLQTIGPGQRIHILDAQRGFALLGILLMNIPYFGLPEAVVGDLTIRNEFSGINYYTWWIVNLFFEGSMRGMFSLMFGATMVLLTDRLSTKTSVDSAAEIYYRRLIWLLLFGLFNAFVIMWPGDILYSYSLCGLFLFPFRRMQPKYLFLVAGILLALFIFKRTYEISEPLRLKNEAVVLMKIDSTKITEDQKEVVSKWKDFQQNHTLEAKKKAVEKEIRKVKGPFPQFYSYYTDINIMLQTTDFYRSNFLDCLIFMIIGIALYKLKILTGERSLKFYLIMACCGYGVAIPLTYWYLHTLVATHFDTIKTLGQIKIAIYEVRRLGLTLGHIGLLQIIYQLGFFRFIYNAWAKIGQMALSNYLLQNILCGLFFYGFAFNHFNDLERYQLYIVVAVIWIINVIFSYIWLSFFVMGPFEWIWRSLTYWHPQPMRKTRILEESSVKMSA